MAQPRKSQPSTLMPVPLPWSACWRASLARPDRLAFRRVAASPDLGMMQVERRALGPDPGDRGEVVPRRRAGGRPFERVAEAPWIVLDHSLAVLPGLVHVVEEEQDGNSEYEGDGGGELVQRRREGRGQEGVGRPPRL